MFSRKDAGAQGLLDISSMQNCNPVPGYDHSDDNIYEQALHCLNDSSMTYAAKTQMTQKLWNVLDVSVRTESDMKCQIGLNCDFSYALD
jgi:hypothetical protein